MHDHANHGASYDAAPHQTLLELEADRLTFAASRVRELANRELQWLKLAVEATNDNTARQHELQADTAWRDALALTSEHHPDQPTKPSDTP